MGNQIITSARRRFINSFNKCAYCGRKFTPKIRPVIDAIRPLSNGGTNEFANRITVCVRCDHEKGVSSLRNYVEKHPSVEKYIRRSVNSHAGQAYDNVDWAKSVKATLKEELGRDIFA